jgi:hypothetical protein
MIKKSLILPILLLIVCTSYASDEDRAKANRLINAYPNFLIGYDGSHIIWKDGFKQKFDDGQTKTFKQRLNNPDLEDQFFDKYPAFAPANKPKFNFDPGRYRNSLMFKRMYGATRREAAENLVTIRWMPRTVNKRIRVTKINGVADQLKKVSRELDSLPHKLKRYVTRLGGTYNWRTISGTSRLSAHSFGVAIDINTKYAHNVIDGVANPVQQ